jgi:hypothetical protein
MECLDDDLWKQVGDICFIFSQLLGLYGADNCELFCLERSLGTDFSSHVGIKITVMSYSLVDIDQHLGGTWCFHVQGTRVSSGIKIGTDAGEGVLGL